MPQPQPISLGRSSQGMPVLRTKRMPVRALRSSRGLRPGLRRRRGLGGARSGCTTSQRASKTRVFAMIRPPKGSRSRVEGDKRASQHRKTGASTGATLAAVWTPGDAAVQAAPYPPEKDELLHSFLASVWPTYRRRRHVPASNYSRTAAICGSPCQEGPRQKVQRALPCGTAFAQREETDRDLLPNSERSHYSRQLTRSSHVGPVLAGDRAGRAGVVGRAVPPLRAPSEAGAGAFRLGPAPGPARPLGRGGLPLVSAGEPARGGSGHLQRLTQRLPAPKRRRA